jgi:hypothetical protein
LSNKNDQTNNNQKITENLTYCDENSPKKIGKKIKPTQIGMQFAKQMIKAEKLNVTDFKGHPTYRTRKITQTLQVMKFK